MNNKKLLTSAGLLLLLGILITVFSIYHTSHMGTTAIQYPLFLYGTTILSLIIGGYIVYLFQEKINTSQVDKLLSILPTNEKKVMKILLERKEIEQKRLGTLSGLNPVKMSRVSSILQERGVIEKKKQGYTNLIVLKKI